jgi:hypothetical protein
MIFFLNDVKNFYSSGQIVTVLYFRETLIYKNDRFRYLFHIITLYG